MAFRFDDDENNERATFEAFKKAQRLKRDQESESKEAEGDFMANASAEFTNQADKANAAETPEPTLDVMFAAPSSPDEYLFSFAEDHDSSLEKKAREWFFQIGLPIGTAKAISSLHNIRAEKNLSFDELEQERLAVERRLRGEWGDQVFEKRIGMARDLLRRASPEAVKLLEQSGLGNDEHMIRRLVRFAESKVVR